MNPAHLVERFVRALGPGAPSAEDEAWAASALTSNEVPLFRRLPAHDRRHAIRVARRVEREMGERAAPPWLGVALLHDVGKYDAGLSVPGRVAATLVILAVGRSSAERWATTSDGARRPTGVATRWRRRVGQYAAHGAIGAEEIRRAQGREAAAWWSLVHHHEREWANGPIPVDVVRVLDAADNA